jgi:putative transposase
LAASLSTKSLTLPAQLDNGPEFIAKAILRWLAQENIDTALVRPVLPGLAWVDEGDVLDDLGPTEI